jgi:subtilisin-like proprotein convertase family protein
MPYDSLPTMKPAGTLAIVLLLIAFSVRAQSVYTYSNSVNADIPDHNLNGLTSTIEVSGIEGVITNLTVFLDISEGYNGDLYGYLSSENGGFTVLLNRVGKPANFDTGYADAGFNVVLSDAAAGDIHLYGGNGGNPVTGTWQPDGRETDSQYVLSTDSRSAMLSSFNNLSPNGTWTLFLSDWANENISTLVDWGFEFQAVPEPTTASLIILGGALAGAAGYRRIRAGKNPRS